MKTELLIQMDGIAKTEDMVFVLGASNVPWDLDHAVLRCLRGSFRTRPCFARSVCLTLLDWILPKAI